MGTTSDKLTYLNTTKQELKQAINNIGGEVTDETTFRQYVNQLDGVYDVLPKTSFQTGTDVTIENCLKGKLDFDNGVVGIGQASQVILPSEYQQVEYIESSGTQYIDTGVEYKSGLGYDITFAYTTDADGGLFGRYANDGTNTYSILLQKARALNGIAITYGPSFTYTITNDLLNRYNIRIINQKLYINDAFITNISDNLANTSYTLYLFRQSSIYGVGKIYRAKFYDGQTLIKDFIPCYRISDNVIGMYDIVNNVFYTNQGTGTFTKGANAPTPNAEIPIKCVTGNIEEVVSGKNKFNENILSQETNYNSYSNGIWTTNSSSSYVRSILYSVYLTNTRDTSKIIKVKPSTNYTLKFFDFTNNTSLDPCITLVYCDSSGAVLSDVNCTDFKTFTTPANCEYLDITRRGNSGTMSFSHIMLAEGTYTSEQLTYEPYKTPTTYQLSLGNNKFYSIGTYADELLYDVENDKVYKKGYIGESTYTGANDENWTSAQYGTNSYEIVVSNIKSSYELSPLYCMSNLFKGVPFGERATGGDNIIYTSTNTLYIRNTTYSSLANFKSMLSTNNLKAIYVLDTPTLTEITDTTLKAQVKAWYYAQSNAGTTIIEGNGDLPMIIKVRALKGE